MQQCVYKHFLYVKHVRNHILPQFIPAVKMYQVCIWHQLMTILSICCSTSFIHKGRRSTRGYLNSSFSLKCGDFLQSFAHFCINWLLLEPDLSHIDAVLLFLLLNDGWKRFILFLLSGRPLQELRLNQVCLFVELMWILKHTTCKAV